MVRKLHKHAGIALSVALGLLAAGPAAAVDFAGERINLTVPYKEGGGADLYSRFLGPLIAERLPGEPTLVIRNVPGAGAIAGSNQFQDRARADGTDIFTASASVTSNFAFSDPRGHYKLDEWIPILSSPSGTVVYTNSSLGIEDASELQELAGQTVRMGANNPTGGDMRVLLAMDLLGVDVQPVFGMNRSAVYPALERGELNLDFSATTSYREQIVPMVEAGTVVPLFTLGFVDDNGEVGRDPAHPELPHFLEVYEQIHGEPLSGAAREAWDNIFNLQVMATRAILLPKDAPEDVVEAYRQAAEQLLVDMENDPELGARAQEMLGPHPQAIGDAAARNLRNGIVFSDEARDWLSHWVMEKFDVTLGG